MIISYMYMLLYALNSIAIQIHQHQTYGNVGKMQNKILLAHKKNRNWLNKGEKYIKKFHV